MYIVYEPKDKYGGLHTQQDMVGLGETYWLFLFLSIFVQIWAWPLFMRTSLVVLQLRSFNPSVQSPACSKCHSLYLFSFISVQSWT